MSVTILTKIGVVLIKVTCIELDHIVVGLETDAAGKLPSLRSLLSSGVEVCFCC